MTRNRPVPSVTGFTLLLNWYRVETVSKHVNRHFFFPGWLGTCHKNHQRLHNAPKHLDNVRRSTISPQRVNSSRLSSYSTSVAAQLLRCDWRPSFFLRNGSTKFPFTRPLCKPHGGTTSFFHAVVLACTEWKKISHKHPGKGRVVVRRTLFGPKMRNLKVFVGISSVWDVTLKK